MMYLAVLEASGRHSISAGAIVITVIICVAVFVGIVSLGMKNGKRKP